MMANDLKNCGFLDGLTNWAEIGTGALTVDESTRGGPGRAVMVNSDPAHAANAAFGIQTVSGDRVPVSAGQTVEAQALYWDDSAACTLTVGVYDAGGNFLHRTVIPVTRKSDGLGPRRGIPGAYTRAFGRFVSTSSGFAGLDLLGYPLAGARTAAILKPFLEVAPTVPGPERWDPGPHLNPDLQLPVWPSILPNFRPQSIQVTPSPLRKEYMSDASIPITRRMTQLPVAKFAAEMILNLEQRDALDQFFLAAAGGYTSDTEFFFLRPDTHQLCFAKWSADGDPSDTGLDAGSRTTKIGLTLTVA